MVDKRPVDNCDDKDRHMRIVGVAGRDFHTTLSGVLRLSFRPLRTLHTTIDSGLSLVMRVEDVT